MPLTDALLELAQDPSQRAADGAPLTRVQPPRRWREFGEEADALRARLTAHEADAAEWHGQLRAWVSLDSSLRARRDGLPL